MSTIRTGWESWIALGAPETNIGTAVAATMLWEGEGADSLTLGYNRTDMRPISGYRATQSAAIRNTHQLPGGALPPMPIWMDGSSLMLLRVLKNHFVGSTNEDGSFWSFKPQTVQQATASFFGCTVVKRTGVDGRAEQYAGGVIDQLVLAGEHGGFVTITPTFKFLRGTHHATAGTGSYAPSTAPYFTAADVNMTWNGEAVYPSAWSITSMNNLPDLVGISSQPRTAYALGAWTGEASLTLPRDDGAGTNFITKYITPTLGTLIISGTASSGTIAGGAAITWQATVLAIPRPYDLPAQSGELTDTVSFDIVNDAGLIVLVASDASAL